MVAINTSHCPIPNCFKSLRRECSVSDDGGIPAWAPAGRYLQLRMYFCVYLWQVDLRKQIPEFLRLYGLILQIFCDTGLLWQYRIKKTISIHLNNFHSQLARFTEVQGGLLFLYISRSSLFLNLITINTEQSTFLLLLPKSYFSDGLYMP